MRKNGFLLIIMILFLTSCATNRVSDSQWTYSHHEGDLKENNDIRYYFIDENGEEHSFSMLIDQDYSLQNKLKIGENFLLSFKDDTILDLEEVDKNTSYFTPIVSGTPGEKTIKNLLSTAFAPVGSTLYVYGGGWNWQDNGSGNEASSIGLSKECASFFYSHDTW